MFSPKESDTELGKWSFFGLFWGYLGGFCSTEGKNSSQMLDLKPGMRPRSKKFIPRYKIYIKCINSNPKISIYTQIYRFALQSPISFSPCFQRNVTRRMVSSKFLNHGKIVIINMQILLNKEIIVIKNQGNSQSQISLFQVNSQPKLVSPKLDLPRSLHVMF